MSKKLVENFFMGMPITAGCTFADALDRYTRRGVSKRTAGTDRYRLEPLCDPSQLVATITAADVDTYVQTLADRLSNTSVESYKESVKAFFKWCQKESIISQSPAVHLKPKRKRSSRFKAASEPDLLVAIQNLEFEAEEGSLSALRDLLAFRLACDSGNRLSELVRLSTRHIELALRHPRYATNGTRVYITSSGPGKKGVVALRFTEATAQVYQRWQSLRPTLSPHVFTSLRGSREGLSMTLGGFTAIFVRRCRQFNIPVYRTHSIRHLKGTKVTDRYSPRVAARILNITIEMAIQHYHDVDDQTVIDACTL